MKSLNYRFVWDGLDRNDLASGRGLDSVGFLPAPLIYDLNAIPGVNGIRLVLSSAPGQKIKLNTSGVEGRYSLSQDSNCNKAQAKY